ncbi:MAG: KEOPS complex subunit Pcc1 [Candidatus Heimdallarchaeaceae archaeon]
MTSKIKIDMKFPFENEKKAKIIYEALINETQYNPNDRAYVELYLKHNMIQFIIHAQDPISARAAINSYLRWLELSQSVIRVVVGSSN